MPISLNERGRAFRSVDTMAISYKRLFNLLDERGLTSTFWLRQRGIHPATISKLKRDERINTDTIDKLCELLECRVEDVMEYIPSNTMDEDNTSN